MTQAVHNLSEKQINDLADALNRGDIDGALKALGLSPADFPEIEAEATS